MNPLTAAERYTLHHDPECVFCRIIAGDEPAEIVDEWEWAIAIVPLDPVVDGHLLVIARHHIRDFTENQDVAAATMWAASGIAVPPCDIITSAGREATQSVFHFHLHVIPRAEGDGLALPWYSGKRRKVGHP